MGKISQALLREKTLPPTKTSVTFNAPGNYLPPYGKTTVRITGRGESSNASTVSGSNATYNSVTNADYAAGNANYNPGNANYNTPNIAGYSPGNIAGYNTPNIAGYSPGNIAGYTPGNITGYNPDLQTQYASQIIFSNSETINNSGTAQQPYGSPCPAPYTQSGYDYYIYVSYSCSSGSANYNPATANYNAPTPNYNASNANYNAPTPNYNPSNISGYNTGNIANYNPPTATGNYYTYYVYNAGNPNYNTSTAGAPTSIMGVTFPGAPAVGSGQPAAAAPPVPLTTTSVQYAGSAISITVPSGGYVTIDNV